MGFVKGASKLGEPSQLRAYLASIAFRLAAMEIRRRNVRRWVMLTNSGDLPDAALPEREPDEARALRALYRILDTLSARDRLVFVARFVEGMQIDETAVALNLSKATVWRVGKAAYGRVIAEAQRDAALVDYVQRALQEQTHDT